MNLRKGSLLRLAAILAALPWTLARYQASIICENGRILTESAPNSRVLYACRTGACSTRFSYLPRSFPTWTGHWLTELYGVDCTTGNASICYRRGGRWYHTDVCTGSYEAVITIVNDYQRRRLGEPEAEQEEFEEEVDIDGETWTVFGMRDVEE